MPISKRDVSKDHSITGMRANAHRLFTQCPEQCGLAVHRFIKSESKHSYAVPLLVSEKLRLPYKSKKITQEQITEGDNRAYDTVANNFADVITDIKILSSSSLLDKQFDLVQATFLRLLLNIAMVRAMERYLEVMQLELSYIKGSR